MNGQEILPGEGIGPIRFGMRMAEVKSALGLASSERYEEDGEYSYWIWEYADSGLGLFFRAAEDLRLCSIEVDCASAARLFGEQLFPSTRDNVIAILGRDLPEREFVVTEARADASELSLYVPSLHGTFYFDHSGLLQEFKWGPKSDDSGHFVWPALD